MNNKFAPVEISEQVIDLRGNVKLLKKRRALIVFVILLTVLTSGILSFFVLPPVYEAKTLLLVTQATDKQETVNQQNDLNSIVNNISRIPVLTMNTYVGQVKSETLTQRVIDKLQLSERGYTDNSLAKQIKATAAKDSSLIEVTVSNTDAQLAADIANTLSNEFLELISEKNQEQMERSVKFMQDQNGVTENELGKATEELKKFDSEPRGVTYLQQELAAKSQDLNKFQSELTRAEIELQQLVAVKSQLEASLVNTPKAINVQKYDQTQGKVVASEEINPVYTDLTTKLNDKKANQAEKEAQVTGTRGVLTTLNGQIDQLQAELTDKKTKQDRLLSEAKRLEETRKLLADKTTQTQIARSVDLGSTSVMVVSPAKASVEPVKPKKMLNMVLAFILGLIASVILAFVLEFLDNTIKTPEGVTQHLNLPVLGMVPVADSKNGERKLFANVHPQSPVAEAFRSLRTNISFSALDQPCRTIMTTSAGPADGKSTVTANMAVVMAQDGGRVLLVDCDLRKPTQYKFFETDNNRGLTNLLAQDLEIPEVVRATEVEGLWFLPSGPIPPNPSELLGSHKMRSFLEKAAGQYDTVLIDSPPVIAVTDAAVLAPLVDGVVLVVKSGNTRIDMVKDAKAQLEKANARIIGVVLNEVKMHGEDYRYYYYYKGKEKPSHEVVL